MTENRRYYYLKLKESFYNTETMVILESMQDGLLYSNLLLKMYLMALKSNGVLMLNDHLPHTPQTIATYTRHQVGTVERALKVFIEFWTCGSLDGRRFLYGRYAAFNRPTSTEGSGKRKSVCGWNAKNCYRAGRGTFVHPMARWTNVRLY